MSRKKQILAKLERKEKQQKIKENSAHVERGRAENLAKEASRLGL